MSQPSLPAPRSLGELCVAAAVGEELGAALTSISRTETLSPDDRASNIEEGRFHLLLVEGGAALGEREAAEVRSLTDRCLHAHLPSVLWVTGGDLSPELLACAAGFTRVFTADPLHLPTLESAGAWAPSVLSPAATLPVRDEAPTETASRPFPLAWIGEWREEWSGEWQSRVAAIVHAAAERGLRIFASGGRETLPESLRDCRQDRGARREAEILRDCRVFVALSRDSESRYFVPGTVFDAIAAGAAVISPHNRGLHRVFRDVLTRTDGGSSPANVIDALLDDEQREKRVHHCRKIVLYNHTYAHRLATLASSVGYRVLPDAAEATAHS